MQSSKKDISILNKEWGKKTICMWLFFMLLYWVCIAFEDEIFLNTISNFTALFIPMINGVKNSGAACGLIAANYFSLIAIFSPFFCFWIIVQDDAVVRISHGYKRIDRNIFEKFILHYFFGIPLLIFLIFLTVVAPFGYSVAPGNFGQTIFYLMLNKKIGLLFLGSIAGTLFAQILIILFWLLSFPLVGLFNKAGGRA